MSANKQEELSQGSLRCYWPLDFTKRRKFDRHAENQTYIQWLQLNFYDGEEDEGDGENEQDGHEAQQEEEEGEEDDDVDSSSDDEDEDSENLISEKEGEFSNRYRNVKTFMEGMTEDKNTLKYLDQVKQVTDFCGPVSWELEPGVAGKKIKSSALLDDRNDHCTLVQVEGDCRPARGPLTSQQLHEELSKPRFRENFLSNTFEEGHSDAERRVIFITDPDASSIEVLATTAPRSQAPALKDLFYKYIAGKTSIGVIIRSQGFRAFTLELHMPYYVLKASKELLKDSRKKLDGEPLRQSWHLPFLPRPLDPSKAINKLPKGYFLYKAQISVAVTGIDESVWTAFGFIDTYFGSKESVRRYDVWRRQGRPGRPDPLAAGQFDADKPIWNPREYFLRVVEIRINQVLREWNSIIDIVKDAVKQSRMNRVFPLSSNDPKARQELRDFITRNDQMMELLRQLRSGLSDTVGAWGKFKQTGIGYFLHDGESEASKSLKPTLVSIDEAFSEFEGLRRKLQDLECELYQDNPQGLHAHLSLENNESANFQRRTATHVEVLTVITIVFYPLALATSLFSTTGVLPFTPNLAYFIYVLVILGALLVVTFIACSNWASLSRPLAKYLTAELNFSKATTDIDDGPVGEEIRHTTASQTLLKRSLLSRGLRKVDFHARGDLEEGTEEGKGGTRPLVV